MRYELPGPRIRMKPVMSCTSSKNPQSEGSVPQPPGPQGSLSGYLLGYTPLTMDPWANSPDSPWESSLHIIIIPFPSIALGLLPLKSRYRPAAKSSGCQAVRPQPPCCRISLPRSQQSAPGWVVPQDNDSATWGLCREGVFLGGTWSPGPWNIGGEGGWIGGQHHRWLVRAQSGPRAKPYVRCRKPSLIARGKPSHPGGILEPFTLPQGYNKVVNLVL